MYTTVKSIHSYWALATLVLLTIAVVIAIMRVTSNKQFTKTSFKWFLYAFIASHIQLVIGMILLYVSPFWKMLTEDMGSVMKNSNIRLYAVEHPFINIIAIILITIGWTKHKSSTTDKGKFKSIAIFYGLGLLLILSRIPWSTWFK